MTTVKLVSLRCVTAIFFLYASETSGLHLANLINSVTNSTDQTHSQSVVPSCASGVKFLEFILFSRKHPYGQVIPFDIKVAPIPNGVKCIIGAHGYLSHPNTTQWYQLIKGLLIKEEIYVFALNWTQAACSLGNNTLVTKALTYNSAANNTLIVGNWAANFSLRLDQQGKCKINQMICIGHSLGAHVCGFAGKDIYERTKSKYAHIIACDPAGPSFAVALPSNRLSMTDAKFTQVIHTTRTLGLWAPLGHVDFFFNAGLYQPGCRNESCAHTASLGILGDSLKDNCTTIGTPHYNFPQMECTVSTCMPVGLCAPLFYRAYNNGTKKYYTAVKTKPYCNADDSLNNNFTSILRQLCFSSTE